MNSKTMIFLGYGAIALVGVNSLAGGIGPAAEHLSRLPQSRELLRADLSTAMAYAGGGLRFLGRGLMSAAYAAGPAPEKVDPTKLVKFDGRSYSVAYGDSISNEPVSQTYVTKIAHGHVTRVNVVTTSSGVYSSEATVSAHVRYPGVTVERAPDIASDGSTPATGPFAVWNGAQSALALPLGTPGATTAITPLSDGGRLYWGDFGTCIASTVSFTCL